MTKLKIIGDRVLLKQMPLQHTSPIAIPEAHQAKSRFFEVMAIGTKRPHDQPFEVKPGDVVMSMLYEGVQLEDPDYWIVPCSNLEAVEPR